MSKVIVLRPRKKPPFNPIVIFSVGLLTVTLIGFILWTGISYLWLKYGLRTAVLTAGQLTVKSPAVVMVVPRETALVAPVNGRMKLLVAGGQRVKAGQEVAELLPPGGGQVVVLRAPATGLWQPGSPGRSLPPGWHERWPPGDALQELWQQSRERLEFEEEIRRGEEAGRVVDNLVPPWMWLKLNGGQGRWVVGERIKVEVAGMTVVGRIKKTGSRGEEDHLLVQCEEWRDDLLAYRRTTCRVVTAEVDGLLVPVSALRERGGTTGLWVVDRKWLHFVPVEVVGQDGELAAVRATGLQPGKRYALNPFLLQEGAELP